MSSLDILKIVEEKLKIPIFLVGGAVRDYVLNINQKDIDLATPIIPDEVEKAIKEAGFKPFLIGKKYGTVGFNLDSQVLVEITTFRNEVYKAKNRKPDVSFVSDLKDDLSRRDFTINALAMDSSGKVYDYFNGLSDLKNKIIKAVGTPKKRFQEDPLRMLRAIRLAGKLGFEIETETWTEIKRLYLELLNLSKERWVMEMDKILASQNVYNSLQLLKESRLLNVIIPEITSQFNYNQNSTYHDYNLFVHTSKVVSNVPKENLDLRWAALLHDIAKPHTQTFDEKKGVNHFYGHEILGVELADSICKRLKFSNKRREYIMEVIKNHLKPGSELKIYDDAGKKLPVNFVKKQVIMISGGDSFDKYEDYILDLKQKELRLNNIAFWPSKLDQFLGNEFEVLKPSMPNTNNAKYLEWKIQFEKLLPILRVKPILIGWSLGGIFLAKYLAENKFQVSQLHLVAAPFEKVGDFELPGNLDLITKNVEKVFIYHSTDDFVVDFKQAKTYQKALEKGNVELIEFSDRNHFLQSKFEELVLRITA